MGKISIIWIVFGLFFLSLSNIYAATIHVPADQPTIQAGINAAVNGDTVLVAPGTYTENVTLLGKRILLSSSGGSDATILEPLDIWMPIVRCVTGEDTTTVIEGFTIRNASKSHGIRCVNSSPIIKHCEVAFCTTPGGTDGAGIWCVDSGAKLRFNKIHDNHGGYTGGGVGGSGYHPTEKYEIFGNAIYNNTSNAGPGIGCIDAKKVWISQNLVYDNGGDHPMFAAGIYMSTAAADASCSIINNTIVGNTRGIAFYNGIGIDVRNNIVVSDTLEGIIPFSATYDYNDVWNNGSNNIPGEHGISADPAFSDPQQYDYSLQYGSVCIDRGDPDPRYNDPDGTRNDIGALYYMRTPRALYVPSQYPTIQAGIDAAANGDTVLVADGIYTGSGNRDIDFLGKAILLKSQNGQEYTIIDCEATTSDRHRGFIFQTGEDTASILDGFTITNAVAKSWDGYYSGGGIAIDSCSPTIRSCVFIDNRADYGGAIYAGYSSTFISNCLFKGNIAVTDGGAIRGYSIYTQNTRITIIGCTFVNNDAENGSAIHSLGDTIAIYNSIFARNAGAALINGYDWIPQLTCTDIYGNSGGDWTGDILDQLGVNGNISIDPLFCSEVSADYHLWQYSPCAPANNSCGVLIGALGVGCEFQGVTAIYVENDTALGHILNHAPLISWDYDEPNGYPQTQYEIAVGTDSDWVFAEMWNPTPVASADTFVTYAGAPLVDGATYYMRLRVHNGSVWSLWYDTTFRMNSVPTVPVLTWPDSGAVVNTATPTLYVHNATDAENDTLVYEFSITNHSMWGPPQTTTGTNVPSGVDSTGWIVSSPLNENWQYIWQARSFDGYEYSDWTPYGERRNLYVNAVEESPWPFELVKPPDTSGNIVFDMLPYFFWGISIDADPLDSVHYTLYLALDSNFQFIQTIEIPENQYTPTDSLFFGTRYWWKVKATDETGRFTYSTDIHNFRTWKLGDANGDWLVNIQDITFIINFLYNEGAEPNPRFVADINGTCLVNIQDITYLINYLYKGGPAPKIGCM